MESRRSFRYVLLKVGDFRRSLNFTAPSSGVAHAALKEDIYNGYYIPAGMLWFIDFSY